MITYIDIETGPLPDAHLAALQPEFKAPSNYKDPAKIAASLVEQEAEWKEKAALSALTGRVLAMGFLRDNGSTAIVSNEDESELLTAAWHYWRTGGLWVGWCIKSFDMSFLVQRSRILRVGVPLDLMVGRYWANTIVDLQELWLCYGRDSRGASLDSVSRALGLGGKAGSGADFVRLWTEDREKAIAYLRRDLELTKAISERIGV